MKLYDKIVRPTTQMLLKRMDTNPDEFDEGNSVLYGSRSWSSIIKHGEFNFVERRLIKRKVVAIRRKATEQWILGLLLDGQARQEDFSLYANVSSNVTINTPPTITATAQNRRVFSNADLTLLQQTDPQKFAKVKKAYEEYYKAQKEE